jgi:type II secretory pathway pseudopilin PulG
MIVIAIIIILAAIAIPNYLRMTERAKVSAIESDMKAIGTALEAYNTDWTHYPYNSGGTTDWAYCKSELLGDGTDNKDGNTTVTGENGGIQYIKQEAINAFETKAGGANNISYTSTNGGDYTLTATVPISGKTYIFKMLPGGQITVSQS